MQSQNPSSVQRQSPRHQGEDAAWKHIYRRVGDAAIAAEVVQHLESDADAKRCHLALYLRCKQTIRREKDRQARNQRVGRFVRRVFVTLLIDPLAALLKLARNGRDLAVEILPETTQDSPAGRRVRKLAAKPAVAQALAGFTAGTSDLPAASGAAAQQGDAARKTA